MSSDRDNSGSSSISTTTTINGDLEWISDKTYSEIYDVDNILCFVLKSDKYQSFQVPDHVHRMKLIIPNTKNIKPPVIPTYIEMLELDIKLGRNMSFKNYYDGAVSILKNLTIPSSVKKLYITFSEIGVNDSKEEALLEILDTDLQVKKSRKVNNKEKEKQKDYFIPPSVTELYLPVISNDIFEFVPPTVTSLALFKEDGLQDTTLLPTIEHLRLVSYYKFLYKNFSFPIPNTLLKITCNEYTSTPMTYIRNGTDTISPWIEQPSITVQRPEVYKKFENDFNLNNLEQNITADTTYLEIFYSYDLCQNGIIPRSIKYLNIAYNRSIVLKHMTIRIPSTVVNVFIHSSLESNVLIVDEQEYYNEKPKEEFDSTFGSSLKELVFPKLYTSYIRPYSLPSNIQHLVLSDKNCDHVPGIVPPSVKNLVINGVFNKYPFQYFPQHLESLELNFTYNSTYPTYKDIDQFLTKSGVFHDNPKYKELEILSMHKDKMFSFTLVSLEIEHSLGKLIIDRCVVKTHNIDVDFDYMKAGALKTLKLNTNYIPPSLKDSSIEVLDVAEHGDQVKIELLPKPLKQLTLSYEQNIDLLSVIDKPIVEASDENSNDRFNFSTPITPGSDTFFYIWRNTYIRNILIDQLIVTHGKVFTRARPVMGSTTLLMNKYLTIWNISVPPSITKMVVHSDIYSTLTKTIPPRMAKLLDGQYHVRLKSKPIPSNTSHLIWPSDDVINVGVIPDGVVSIFFNNSFNQPILPNTIPDSVLSLQFGDDFDIDLEFISFPPKLKYLNLGCNYNKPIKPNCLPSTLKHLTISSELLKQQQQQKQNNFSFIPRSCNHLKIYQNGDNDYSFLPSHISFIKMDILVVDQPYFQFPATVKSIIAPSLYMDYLKITTIEPPLQRGPSGLIQETSAVSNSTQRLDESIQVTIQIQKNQIIKPNSLINNITTVEFAKDFNAMVLPNTFPETVETIIFGENYNQQIMDGVLPSKLKKLVFGRYFNKPIAVNILPSSLEELQFGEEFQQVLSLDILPKSSLKKLTFLSGCYNKNLVNWIPESVNELILAHNTPNSGTPILLSVDKLPQSITTLILGDKQSIQSPSLIPSHIKHLRLGPCVEYDKLTSPSSLESLELSKHHNYPLQFLIGSAKDN